MIQMKNIKYILLAILGVFVATACSDDKDNPVFDATSAVAPKLTAISSSYVLTKDKADAEFANFSYSKADWGVNLATSYTLQASLTNDFAKVFELATTQNTSVSVTNKDINTILINKGIMPGTATPMYFRVLANAVGSKGTVSSISTLTSTAVNATVTPYDMDVIYPKVYVLGDYNGWSHDKALFLFSFESNTVYAGIIDFGENYATYKWGFKITGAASWDNATGNWGATTDTQTAESPSLELMNNGKNITAYQGANRFYHFTFDETKFDTPTLTKDYAFNALSIVGDAGSEVTGWGKNEVDMTFDTAKQRFQAEVNLSDGVIKFRADHAWSLNWGGSNGELKAGGDNISVKAGKYRIYVNLNNPSKMTYTLISLD